jgi:hypothetical protein
MAKGPGRGRPVKGHVEERGLGQWRARVRLEATTYRKTFLSRSAAEAWLDALIGARPDRLAQIARAREMTLAQAMRKRIELKHRKTNDEQRAATERLIRDFPDLCHRCIYDVDETDIQEFIRDREAQGVSAGTINHDLTLLSNSFNLARSRMGCIKLHNPIGPGTRLPIPAGRVRRLAADEEAALLQAAAIHECGASRVPIGAIVRFAADTAMRMGEIAAMDWKHADVDRGTVYIPHSKNGEGRCMRCSRSGSSARSSRGCAGGPSRSVLPMTRHWSSSGKRMRGGCWQCWRSDLPSTVCACIRRRLVWWTFVVHRARDGAARNAGAASCCWGSPTIGDAPGRGAGS